MWTRLFALRVGPWRERREEKKDRRRQKFLAYIISLRTHGLAVAFPWTNGTIRAPMDLYFVTHLSKRDD